MICDYCGLDYGYSAACPFDGTMLLNPYDQYCPSPNRHDLKWIPQKYEKYRYLIQNNGFQSAAACPNCRTPYFYSYLTSEQRNEFNRLRNAATCFIATAAMGSHLHPGVQSLRHFRDNVLLKSRHKESYEGLLDFYYKFSPPIARAMSKNTLLRVALRYLLVYPVVFGIKIVLPAFNLLLGIEKDARSRK